jgi:hypothetical protein
MAETYTNTSDVSKMLLNVVNALGLESTALWAGVGEWWARLSEKTYSKSGWKPLSPRYEKWKVLNGGGDLNELTGQTKKSMTLEAYWAFKYNARRGLATFSQVPYKGAKKYNQGKADKHGNKNPWYVLDSWRPLAEASPNPQALVNGLYKEVGKEFPKLVKKAYSSRKTPREKDMPGSTSFRAYMRVV